MSALENLIANMSVAQLAEMAGMDVESMVTLVLGGRGTAAAPKARGRRGGRKKAEAAPVEAATQAPAKRGSGHNTRTKSGRDALDAAILDYLKSQSEPVRALDIRKGVGGTAAQVRTRLNFLITQGKVTYKGRASGTRYKAK